ncbi:hypothetical protein BLNAU_14896 [Blattamonas nauphoetae]|uniref:Uncharacterized protein n=1 Tax=Blattamonas nauphoetae TaxID=2049346 RepID=A0ABQ9XFM5_9EUKA|nr:hypothetical protein BLNAU_14896 [Blattamonas nauphoetae]
MLFEDKSKIYNSLVALVKAGYPFDKPLQAKAAQFLKSLEQRFYEQLAGKIVTDLVPFSAGSPSGFVESILTLLSSPHSTVVAAAISFLQTTAGCSSSANRCRLGESDLIAKVFAIVQPHTLPIAGNEMIIENLIKIIFVLADIAAPVYFIIFNITSAIDKYNHQEMIFQKIVLPSCISRMAHAHFCGLSSDVGNALIAGADEQILRLPPIVQKWFALLASINDAL